MSTPYGHPERGSPHKYPPVPSLGEVNCMFMAPLSCLMHHGSAALHTPSSGEELALFSTPYPIANPPAVPKMILHSPNPCPIAGDHPLASTVSGLTSCEVEYFCTFQVAPHMPQEPLHPDWHCSNYLFMVPYETPLGRVSNHGDPQWVQGYHLQATPYPQPPYVPPWLPNQQGPLPLMCHDLISPFYYILSPPLLSLLISSFQPFSQLYSCIYCVVGSFSQAIDGNFP